jgi:threonine/homoserine/homoserine lactone efflux protein
VYPDFMLEALPPLSDLWRPLLSLLLASSVVMGSPGPSTISLSAVAAAFGARRALPYMAGLVLGTVVVMGTVLCGLLAALLAVPALATVFVLGSTAYLLYLAYCIARAPPLSLAQAQRAAPTWVAGLLLGIANPKAWIAIAAVVAGATFASAAPILDALLKALVLSVMIVLIHLCWMLVGALFAGALADPRRARIVNVALAIALAASSLLALLH